MTEYERGFIDGIKSKVSSELTPTIINVSKTALEMLKPVLSTALENALNDNNAITVTDVQPVNQWISVEERLPEESGTYICAAKSAGRNIVTFVKWQPRYKQWDLTGARSYWQITHWQPLPEPPKDGETE